MLRLRHGLHHSECVQNPRRSGAADRSHLTTSVFFCSVQVPRIREPGLPDDPRPAGVRRVPSRAAALHLRPQLPHTVGPGPGGHPAASANGELSAYLFSPAPQRCGGRQQVREPPEGGFQREHFGLLPRLPFLARVRSRSLSDTCVLF